MNKMHGHDWKRFAFRLKLDLILAHGICRSSLLLAYRHSSLYELGMGSLFLGCSISVVNYTPTMVQLIGQALSLQSCDTEDSKLESQSSLCRIA